MFAKSCMPVLFCCLTASLAAYNGPLAGGQPAALYPAGVDPKACPNFPVCSNPSVAVNQVPEQARAQYAPAPQQPAQYQQPIQYQQPSQYQQPQYQQPQYQQPQYQQPQAQYQQPIQYEQPNRYTQSPLFQPTGQAAGAPAGPGQYASEVQNALDRGEYIGDGDYHGEGLAEALAPGFEGRQNAGVVENLNVRPSNPAVQYNGAPTGQYRFSQSGSHGQPAQVPAGVDPNACPNYPFCG
ncbi:unnamed protein product [Phyllotreta striolata]|uniref:Cuticle protein CPCFC domain-containing protein n=1 Tax=Phyllotreta striolata TaxID=444603 RepID=A0A9N9TF05_PHYSR|nr:unnamed protein product [Phyllotreta striolata]